jgi:uncharacterized protein YjbI with pentapeptide repeats
VTGETESLEAVRSSATNSIRRCQVEMLSGRCDCQIYSAPEHDEEPACLLHSRDPQKSDSEFQQEFERVLKEATDRNEVADFTRFIFPSAQYAHREFKTRCRFDHATFTQKADFSDATFTNAIFSDATFTQNAIFDRATFMQIGYFYGATFTQEAEAYFCRATFIKGANFENATFAREAYFLCAEFMHSRWRSKLLRRLSDRFSLAAWYRHFSAYGESYWRPFLWLLFFVLALFPFLYPVFGLEFNPPSSAAPGWLGYIDWATFFRMHPAEHPSGFSGMILHSLMTSLSVAGFQRELRYVPSYPWGRMMALFELLLTTTLGGLFLLAIRRQFKR